MKCYFTRKIDRKIIIFSLFFPLSLLFGQNNLDTSKSNIIKSCISNDSPLLTDIFSDQQKLGTKLTALQARQEIFAKQRDAHDQLTPDLLEEANNLRDQGDILNEEIKQLHKKIVKISYIVEKKYFDNYFGVVRYIGNSTIESNDKIYANVSALNGNFILATEIKGDLAVSNGALFLKNNSKVDGKIILINSRIISDSGAETSTNSICGNINQNDEPYNEFSEENQYSFNLTAPQFKVPGTDFLNSGMIRYDKVEGLYLGMISPKKYYWNGKNHNSLYGSFGYGFANHSWEGSVNFDKWFGNEFRTEFGGEYHNLVDSKDNWRITSEENSLAAFFIHEDYKDYYKKDGWDFHLAQYFDKNFRVRFDFLQDNNNNISNNTDWSLFSKDKTFRKNPEIDSGKIRSVIIGFDHITVYGKDYIPNGWNISAQYEIANGGDFNFNRFLFDMRRYQKISEDFRVNTRILIGSSEKYLPPQRTFELGGVGTIPSLGFKEFEGNRMILFNAEMLFNVSRGEDLLPIFFAGNDLVVFYDAGFIDKVPDEKKIDEGFDRFTFNGLKQDIGFAICFWRGSFRLGASFRLDQNESPKLFIRLTQPF